MHYMDLVEAKKVLIEAQEPQLATFNTTKLYEAFKVFWDTGPDEDEFYRYCDYPTLTPRMLWYMTRVDSRVG